jgi:hypothetical protein
MDKKKEEDIKKIRIDTCTRYLIQCCLEEGKDEITHTQRNIVIHGKFPEGDWEIIVRRRKEK